MAFSTDLRLGIVLLVVAGLFTAPVLSVPLWPGLSQPAVANAGDCCTCQGDAGGPMGEGSGEPASQDPPPGDCERCVHLCAGCGKPVVVLAAVPAVFLYRGAGELVTEPAHLCGSDHLTDILKPPQA